MPRTSKSPRQTTRNALIVDEETSKRLGKIRQHGTSAELLIRSLLHRLGFRFRIRNRDLPGSPDIANRSHEWAVFVHGCFWHRHPGCSRATVPKRNRDFWMSKFEANVLRDSRVQQELRRRGWRVVVVWECETELRREHVVRRLRRLRDSV